MTARKLLTLGAVLSAAAAQAQIPDLLTAFDAGGRSLGMGGALGATGTGTSSILDNPAGMAYTSTNTFGLTFRNLSESRTIISNNFRDPDYSTTGNPGNRQVTHAGFATPLGKMGVLGISYTVGGFIRDQRTGTNLADGDLTVRNYVNELRAKTDFFTISLARAKSDFSMAWGIGLVFASHNVREFESYELFRADGSQVDTGGPLDNKGTATGIGAVVGVQMTPGGDANQSIGLSLRSPIKLSNGGEATGYYSEIPMKASAGYARRVTSQRRPEDFYLIGFQADAYFGGKQDQVLSRDGFQLVGGAGIEYHLRRGSAYIPIRLGYHTMSRGGDGFSPVSGFSFGFGYSPDNSRFGVDLDFNSNSTGGMDMSLGLTYRVKR